ncbi:MAG: phosphoglucomutase/phosphomannomutase family protein [Candidatus Omnitrophica bacterium]|nr:phosphoglucomutase/phosphomannomutase family protein [Candidatus Omnitrophota bacterium]
MTIRFGTEGWRAIMAEEFTVANVRAVTQALAEHLLATRPRGEAPKVVVGYDTRFLSDHFARRVCEVLAATGVSSVLADRAVPTCAVSRYVVEAKLACGIMITASHNPAIYNGLKVKESFGGSATTETVASIERRIGRRPPAVLPLEQALAQGLVRNANLLPAFLNGIKRSVDLPVIRRSRLKVVVETMHGAGGTLTGQLLAGGRCRVHTLHANPDPLFGGHAPEPIPTHLTELKREVLRRRWDVGLATDGDADRLGVVASNGMFVPPGQVLCVLAEHLMTTRRWRGAVVKSISNTSMINRLADALGLKLIEVPVGFKHIAKLMQEDDVLIGGEESGGIGVRGYLPERDGIFMGLLVLEAMAMQGRGLREILRRLERRFGRWFYARRDLTVSQDRVAKFFERLHRRPPDRVAGVPVSEVKRLDGVKLIGRDDSWLLFRRSGTEPIVRVYAESPAAGRVNRLLAFGVQLVKRT